MHRLLALAFTAAALWLPLAAQSPIPALGPAMPAPLPDSLADSPRLSTPTAVPGDELSTDVEAGGRIWAAAGTWKVSFDAAGATFVPFFGASAPRLFPTRFGAAAATVGGTPLGNQPAAPALGERRVDFAGSCFIERYELRAAGIEQQFVFASLPCRGALDITVPVATDLAVTATADGFRFAGELGSFGYGRAFAFDALGRRTEVATKWTGAAFVLSVPAAFVAEAALPLLVDPLVGNVTMLSNDSKPLAATDMAYDDTLGVYALAYERVFSATDSDVYVRWFDQAMQPLPNGASIDLTTTSWRKPKIAGLNAHDRFLVVAEKSTGNASPFRAGARIVFGGSATMLAQFEIYPGNNGDALNPDVGGDPAPTGPAEFCVVTEQVFTTADHDIMSARYTGDGVLVTSSVHWLDSAMSKETHPVVSKSCGAPDGGSEAWGVTWRRDDPNGTSEQVAAFVRKTGAPTLADVQPYTFPTAGSSVAISSPTRHEEGRLFAMARIYDVGGAYNMTGWAIDLGGNRVASMGVWGSSALPHGPLDLDSDGTRFVLTKVSESSQTPGLYLTDAVLLGMVGNYLQAQDWVYVPSGGQHSLSVVGRYSGGATSREYGLGWIEDLTATTARVECARLDGVQVGTMFALRSTGCGGIGLSTSGAGTSGLGDSFTLQHTATQGFLGFVVGLPVDQPIGPCPGCRQGAQGNTLFAPSYSFTIPRNPAFVGLTLAFQGFQIDMPGFPGACLGQVNLTDTLDATIR
jgi:hypothetical protein